MHAEGSLPRSPDESNAHAAAVVRIYRLLRLAAVVTALVVAIWLAGGILMVVFASVLLAVIFHGLAALLQRLIPVPLWLALAVVLLVLLALVISFGLLAGPGLAEQATNLRDVLTSQASSIQSRVAGTSWGRLVLQYVPESLGGHHDGGLPGLPTGFAGSIAGLLGSVFGLFGTVAVVVITAIYLAATPQVYVDGLLRLVKEEHRPKTRTLCHAAGHALWYWSLGQALDMLVVGTLSGLGLWFIGVPMALALGVVAGLANFVPYIGAIAGAIPAAIIAFSAGPTQGYETIVLFLAVQGFEGNVLAPVIQNRTVELPPGLTILSQTVFGAVLGLAGLIFATPLCAALLAVADKAVPPLRPEDRA